MDSVELFDPVVLAKLRAALADLDDYESRKREVARAPVAPGSLAETDLALPEGGFVTIYAMQNLTAAIDHLEGWRSIAHGPRIWIRSPMTLLRGGMEGAARCRWYVDRSQAPGVRVGRGIAGRIEDQDERRKFQALSQRPRDRTSPRSRTAVERLADMRDPAATARRRTAGVAEVGFTDTTALMTAEGVLLWYRLSSGLSHGYEWALAAAELKRDDSVALGPGIGAGHFSVSPDVVYAMTLETLHLTRRALADLVYYRTGID